MGGAFGDLDGPKLTYRKQEPTKLQERASEFAYCVSQLATEQDFLKRSKKADREKHQGRVEEAENNLDKARRQLHNAVKRRNIKKPLVFKVSRGVVVVWLTTYKSICMEHCEFETGRFIEE